MSKLNREAELIEKSGLFDREWYLSEYPDVKVLGMDPIKHYLRIGALLQRNPGPHFDTQYYLSTNPDVVEAGMNPFLHYVKYGQKEGRCPLLNADRKEQPHFVVSNNYLREIATRRLSGEPIRFREAFDFSEERKFMRAIDEFFLSQKDEVDTIKASVVMPTYNRARQISRAVQSVIDQTHKNWELIIVDDGSTDDTVSFIEQHLHDQRIRLIQNNRQGVSAARNAGLNAATSDVVFYLDSDNSWTPQFLRTMIAFMKASGAECAYSGICVEDANGQVRGYRGELFDWKHCLKSNYIDMNAFGHNTAAARIHGTFDTSLRRMVDWDLILRYTKHYGAAYAPFLGCYYFDDKNDANRISVGQPYVYRFIVQEKNKRGLNDTKDCQKYVQLRFAIKIPAPYDKRQAWGDFHFAESLAHSLEQIGHKTRIDFLGDWYKREVTEDDVVIVLRGLTAYEPRPGQINIMWNISHPDQVSYDEYNKYDIVYVASLSYPSLLSEIVEKPVKSLLQCSDKMRFPYTSSKGGISEPALFIGNSRKEYRDIVRWAVEAEAPTKVIGGNWDEFIPKSMIYGLNVSNTELHKYYNSAAAVLNDHWESMREYGFLSNRLFDIVACGGRAISDRVPSISRVFGNIVEQVSGSQELSAALANQIPLVPENRKRASEFVHAHHSFDARAKTICDHVFSHLGVRESAENLAEVSFGGERSERIQVGLILQQGKQWPTSSGFIRLLAPLTHDSVYQDIEVVVLSGAGDPRLVHCDVCIVQRLAIADITTATTFTDACKNEGIPVVVDNDDALGLVEAHQEKDRVLRFLMDRADEVWLSTPALRDCYSHVKEKVSVIPNCLDPRLWKDYRAKRAQVLETSPVEFLYMGTATHDADFATVVPAFDLLHEKYPGKFNVTIVGAVRKPPARSWMRSLPVPPSEGSYPKFVRWLVKQQRFDFGLAPLENSAFNECKSDVKFLDYTALGVVSILPYLSPYKGIIDKDLALSAGNSADSWFSALEMAILERENCSRLISKASEYLWIERHCSKSGMTMRDRIMCLSKVRVQA